MNQDSLSLRDIKRYYGRFLSEIPLSFKFQHKIIFPTMLLAEHTTRRRRALVRGDGVSQPMLHGAKVEKLISGLGLGLGLEGSGLGLGLGLEGSGLGLGLGLEKKGLDHITDHN